MVHRVLRQVSICARLRELERPLGTSRDMTHRDGARRPVAVVDDPLTRGCSGYGHGGEPDERCKPSTSRACSPECPHEMSNLQGIRKAN